MNHIRPGGYIARSKCSPVVWGGKGGGKNLT